jgi:sugar lactone lactonase YvrE
VVAAECELVLDARAALGEGALWDTATSRLLWVDIDGLAVHRFDPASGIDVQFAVPAEPGTVVAATNGRLVVALPDGIHLLDHLTGNLEPFASIPHDPGAMLLNDGKCDPQGRLWVGSLTREATPGAAALYRVDPDRTVTAMVRNVTISNGVAWSPDGSTMYYIDTPSQRVDAFDFAADEGRLSHRRRLVHLPADAGAPDGMAVDADGFLWVAMWDGGALRRHRPDGSLDAILPIGTPRVTSCAFGGPGLDELYVTTARVGLDPDIAERTHAGAVYRIRPGVRGLASTPFGAPDRHGFMPLA